MKRRLLRVLTVFMGIYEFGCSRIWATENLFDNAEAYRDCGVRLKGQAAGSLLLGFRSP